MNGIQILILRSLGAIRVSEARNGADPYMTTAVAPDARVAIGAVTGANPRWGMVLIAGQGAEMLPRMDLGTGSGIGHGVVIIGEGKRCGYGPGAVIGYINPGAERSSRGAPGVEAGHEGETMLINIGVETRYVGAEEKSSACHGMESLITGQGAGIDATTENGIVLKRIGLDGDMET